MSASSARLAAASHAFLALLVFAAHFSARGDALDNWTTCQLVNTNGSLSGVAYGNGRYVTVGQVYTPSLSSTSLAIVQISDDGQNWTWPTRSDTSIRGLWDVTFANGTFVAVGTDIYEGTNIYSSTDGITWSHHQTGIRDFFRVIYGGGLFVATGSGGLLSTNGTAQYSGWTNRQFYTSPDGVTWTGQRSGSSGRAIWDVAYGAGRFVAFDGGAGPVNALPPPPPGSYYFYVSADASLWTRTNSGLAGPPLLNCCNNPEISLNFCNDLFILPLTSKTNLLSADGLNWTTVSNNVNSALGRIIYGAGVFLALPQYNPAVGYSVKVFTSPDGTNWIARTTAIPSEVFPQAVVYGNGRFVIAGYNSSSQVPVAYISDPVVSLGINPGLPPALQLSGLVGRTYRVERLDDLSSTNWQTVATVLLTNSPSMWADTSASGTAQFYRAALLP